MKILGIIPARYASSRFPGKPLVHIKGKSMVQRVYEQAKQVIDTVFIATDDLRIRNHILEIGANAIMTSNKHKSGTERCAEALKIITQDQPEYYDIVVNIQGDEPLISPEAIKQLINAFNDNNVQIATLVNKLQYSDELNNKNTVKVILNKNNYAQYFSRALIPFVQNEQIKQKITFYKHIGIYAYKPKILLEITSLPQSNTEIAESLEQNRWIEYDYKIKAIITSYKSVSVDTPKDLEKVLLLLQQREKNNK